MCEFTLATGREDKSMHAEKIKKNIIKGSPVRLFPVMADSKKEERATSILLSVFSAVPDFARAVLENAGASLGKRSQMHCYAEVSFKGSRTKARPDGLILVTSGTKTWGALVESKVGRTALTPEQIEEYLDVAKEQGLNAVITISNQFAALPSHHPVKVPKNKLRQVELYHFSWLSLESTALMLIDGKAIEDPEQAFLLRELVRYFQADASGVSSDVRMSPAWRETCAAIHQGTTLLKSSDEVAGAVADWYEFMRYLCIKLSLALGQPSSVWMPRKHQNDPAVRLQDGVAELVDKQELTAWLDVPNAAGRIQLTASPLRKTLDLQINVDTPRDVKQQRAAIHFVVGQLKDYEGDDLIVRVNWPGRVPSTQLPIRKALDEHERKALIPEVTKELPSSIDLIRIVDMGAKIKTSNGLPEQGVASLVQYYREVVQGLQKWVPKAPQVREQKQPSEPRVEPDTGTSAITVLVDEEGDDPSVEGSTLMIPNQGPD